MKKIKGWIGIVDGRPYTSVVTDDYGQYDKLHVFLKKAPALKRFECVEPAEIEIRQAPKGKR